LVGEIIGHLLQCEVTSPSWPDNASD
jgi:hypothetical protein